MKALELQDEIMVDSVDFNQTELAATIYKQQMQRAYRLMTEHLTPAARRGKGRSLHRR